jgi:recombination protein RecA
MSKNPETGGLKAALQVIEQRHGKGAVMRLGDRTNLKIETIPSGCLSLDLALGGTGLPRGRIVEIFGPEASGKTTLTLHALAEAQAAGGICAFVDAEHALDPGYAAALGVNTDDLLIAQPDCGEQALEIVDLLTRSGEIDMVVIDSVAALVPRTELEGNMGDTHVGLQARLMSQALRKLTAQVARTGTIVLFINQLRQKIGGMGFGPKEVTTGGNALKFYCSVRIDIRRIGAIKRGEEVIGNRTKIKVVKNKLAPPFRFFETDIYYGQGIAAAADLLSLGEKAGLVRKKGSYHYVGDELLGQGREAAFAALAQRVDLMAAIRHGVLVGAGVIEVEPGAGPVEATPKQIPA